MEWSSGPMAAASPCVLQAPIAEMREERPRHDSIEIATRLRLITVSGQIGRDNFTGNFNR